MSLLLELTVPTPTDDVSEILKKADCENESTPLVVYRVEEDNVATTETVPMPVDEDIEDTEVAED